VLLDTSCAIPCWQQIVPGTSSESSVNSLLSNVPEIDPASIDNYKSPSYGATSQTKWRFYSNSGDVGGRIYFKDGVVLVTQFALKKGALTLENAIQVLGEPEYTYAFIENGEVDRMIIYLLYPTKGSVLLYNSGRSRNDAAIIEPKHSIEYVMYFDPVQFEEVATSGLLLTRDLLTLQQNMQPWQGYGEVDYIEYKK
jgi:hypothetical protein